MAASGGIFGELHTGLKEPIVQSVDAHLTAFASYVQTPVRSALVLAILFTGLHMIFGVGSHRAGRMGWLLVRWCFVAWIVTDMSVWSTYVKDLFLSILPDGLSSALSGSLAVNAFDDALMKAWAAGLRVSGQASMLDIGTHLVVILFVAAAVVSLVWTYAIWEGTYITLALLVVVSPLLVPTLLFAWGRTLVMRYAGALISAVLLQVLSLTLAVLTIAAETKLLGDIAASNNSNPTVELWLLVKGIVLFAFVARIVHYLPQLATSIGGGIQAEAGGMIAVLTAPVQRGASMLTRAATGVAGQIRQDFGPRAVSPAQRSAGASIGDAPRRAAVRSTP